MSLLTWLFPNVDLARREALARINAISRQMDEAHKAEQPIRDLIADVTPLMLAAEKEGKRLTAIEVPPERQLRVTMAKAESEAIMGRLRIGGNRPAMLFGLPIKSGPELRVVTDKA